MSKVPVDQVNNEIVAFILSKHELNFCFATLQFNNKQDGINRTIYNELLDI